MPNEIMNQESFQKFLKDHYDVVQQIRLSAHQIHEHVNQMYDVSHSYGYHLDMVANGVCCYGHEVCAQEGDILPMIFGAYYHDSIEDARLTYNDVKKEATRFMDERQAFIATEIVYALTNDKGRTRAERAGEKYYMGIRETPYAPFVKLADRLANATYSSQHYDALNVRMKDVYRKELHHFMDSITSAKAETDMRFVLPHNMLQAVGECLE